MSELHDIDRRVAVLEQIAADTRQALQDIRDDIWGMRAETQGLRGEMQQLGTGLRSELQQIRLQQHADFRWLLRFMIGGFVGVFALLAHGLHWF